MNPLVSIVIPSFNQARFLEETLRTVFFQDYTNLEVLLVDGGSTDGSVDIIQRYADRLAHYARLAPYNWFNFYDYWEEDGS